ncbi:MAG: hypothetical protein CMQ20_03440 [Gammaproteobacteria bacterium]|nr:hypothetical protein [Gammaproteobacteria bacterium]MBQ74063.1 hypothetical protein [Gammaproteobacteria bacterium]
MVDPVISLSIRCAFVLLFAAAAIKKIRNPSLFVFQLEQYQLLPDKWLRISAVSIVLIELGVATLMVTPLFFHAVLLGVLLLGVYLGAMLVNLLRDRAWIDCGCLGTEGEGLSYWLAFRNLILLTVLLVAVIPVTGRPLLWLDYWTIVSVVIATSTGYLGLNTLLAANLRSKTWWA